MENSQESTPGPCWLGPYDEELGGYRIYMRARQSQLDVMPAVVFGRTKQQAEQYGRFFAASPNVAHALLELINLIEFCEKKRETLNLSHKIQNGKRALKEAGISLAE